MSSQRRTPIVIGVADVVNRSLKLEDAVEPAGLMLQAILSALNDTELPSPQLERLQSDIDSIDVVRTWTWPYPDLPGLLAEKLRVRPAHKFYSDHGGNKPGKLFDEAARRVSLGQSKVAVVTGGEALASLSAFAAAKKLPPPGWTKVNESVDSVFSPSTRPLKKNLGAIHEIGAPIQAYPLYENGFRAHRGQSIRENHDESALLYAEFAQIAEQHPYAWNHGKPAETKESIGTVTKRNRMICFPYPLLMNAFNTVNLAAACILTSVEYARELGVPQTKWIYAVGGAGTRDDDDFWKRPNFYSSPSVTRSLDAGLACSGLTTDDIDLFDFYSCFPIVPKIAATHLGLPITGGSRPLTLLGGLTSFGGAGNNYSMHVGDPVPLTLRAAHLLTSDKAITEMVRQLRKGKGRHGLILANGGVFTYQHVVCLSTMRRRDGSPYPDIDPLPEVVTDVPIPAVDSRAEGEATIETYTVEFNRDGSPLRGYIVGRLKSSGHRFLANHGDEATLQQLSSGATEQVGRPGFVTRDRHKDGRNLFTFRTNAKL